MEIIPLGTNGFFPSFGRETACYIIPYRKVLIILDAGSGLFRLVEPEGQRILNKASEIHLFLSHYHLDHTFGFYAAFRLFAKKKVSVFAPDERKVFSELPPLKYFPIDYREKHKNFRWISLASGGHKISSYKVMVKRQKHREEISLAFRFEFVSSNKISLVYLTDQEPSKKMADFSRDASILLHEHWLAGRKTAMGKKEPEYEKEIVDGHITSVGAAMLAKEAKVKKLVLVHHHPLLDNQQLKRQLGYAKSIFGNSALGCDLKQLQF